MCHRLSGGLQSLLARRRMRYFWFRLTPLGQNFRALAFFTAALIPFGCLVFVLDTAQEDCISSALVVAIIKGWHGAWADFVLVLAVLVTLGSGPARVPSRYNGCMTGPPPLDRGQVPYYRHAPVPPSEASMPDEYDLMIDAIHAIRQLRGYTARERVAFSKSTMRQPLCAL